MLGRLLATALIVCLLVGSVSQADDPKATPLNGQPDRPVPVPATDDRGGRPKPEELLAKAREVIDLGTLGQYFELVGVDEEVSNYNLILELKAKEKVDTSRLFFKIGVFDQNKRLLTAVPLQFNAGFLLEKGESITATAGFPLMNYFNNISYPRPEQVGESVKIIIRKIDNPTPKSEYHAD